MKIDFSTLGLRFLAAARSDQLVMMETFKPDHEWRAAFDYLEDVRRPPYDCALVLANDVGILAMMEPCCDPRDFICILDPVLRRTSGISESQVRETIDGSLHVFDAAGSGKYHGSSPREVVLVHMDMILSMERSAQGHQ